MKTIIFTNIRRKVSNQSHIVSFLDRVSSQVGETALQVRRIGK